MEFTEDQKNQYKQLLIETFKAFDTFCNDNGIKYYAGYGTAIGAIRHRGLIPWDDDIDVVMLRDDYERFLSIKSKLEGTHYRIIDPTDKGYYLPFAKFSNQNSTLWEVENYEFVIGAFVDVFPLDYVSGDIETLKKQHKKDKKLFQNTFVGVENLFCRTILNQIFQHPGLFILWVKKILFIKPFFRFYKTRFMRRIESYKESKDGDFLFNHFAPYPLERELLQKKWFDKRIRLPFESEEIYIMYDYHNYLTQLYGDYMVCPPVEKQVSHHFHFFFDLNQGLDIKGIKSILYNS